MPAPPNCVFTVFAFVGFFFCLIRFPMQFHAWNVGTHLYLAWVGLGCLFMGINSIIWNHNTENWAPVWCDITIRFNVGISVAIPAIIICINRRLYLLASLTSIISSHAEMNRELIIDLVVGIGLPIVVMALSFLVQDSRFIIVEDFGCCMSILPSWVSLIIINIPTILLEFIAGFYGCLNIHAFYDRPNLNETQNNLNAESNRYIRFICFSTCDLLCGIPITLFYLYTDLKALVPFPGLTIEHYKFSKILQVPASVWRASTCIELSYELNRWIIVWGAFVFFVIFGFTEESRNNYRAMLQYVLQDLGVRSRSSSNGEGIVFYNSHDSREDNLPDS